MKFLPLLWAGLWRKPTRTTLTLLSIVVAFILFGILSGIDAGFAYSLSTSRLDRLFTDPRFGAPMNISYAEQIAHVPDWTVTGSFESGGSGLESELLSDSETLLSSMRANAFKSMTVMLAQPDDFNRLKAALSSNPTLLVDTMHETDYMASQAKQLNGFLTVVAYLVGASWGSEPCSVR